MNEELPIEITSTTTGAWTVLSVAGDLDMATAPHLEDVCTRVSDHLAIDLSAVRFIDSSGLRALFAVNQSTSPMALVAPSAVVRRLLTLTDMDRLFTIIDDPSSLPA